MLLEISHVCKSFGAHDVLVDVSLRLGAGERVGLVGRNGCGKTTLLRILAGEEPADTGHARRSPPSLRVGYLPQAIRAGSTRTVREEVVCGGDAGTPWWGVEKVLSGLGFAAAQWDQRIASLSGGEKTRLSLAKILVTRPEVLLLDEPTNHLDIAMMQWVEDWLREFRSLDPQVLGFVLTSAVGRSASEYLEQKIWQPIGAEADATWLIDRSGQEATLCCLNAVLRDYARLGLLLAHDGNWRGRQIIPAAWVRDATSRHPDQRHLWPGTATPFLGYGYQTWIWPGEARRFAFLGIRGQSILVDPQRRLVMVQTSVRKRPSNDPSAALTRALWEAVAATLGN